MARDGEPRGGETSELIESTLLAEVARRLVAPGGEDAWPESLGPEAGGKFELGE